jgi:hypothetical protein
MNHIQLSHDPGSSETHSNGLIGWFVVTFLLEDGPLSKYLVKRSYSVADKQNEWIKLIPNSTAILIVSYEERFLFSDN